MKYYNDSIRTNVMKLLKNSIVIFMICCSTSNSSIVVEDIENGSLSLSKGLNHKDLDKKLVNIYQDVEGVEDNYLRCSICMFRFFGNTSQTLSKILMVGSGIMTAFVAVPDLFSPPIRITFGTISSIFSLSSVALLSFKSYSKEAIEDREEQLKHVLKAHGIDIGD